MAKITNPSAFILFAPASDTTVASTPKFQGVPTAAVTEYKGTSSAPGGLAPGGTHNTRKRINALFADLHSENMLWSGASGPRFLNDSQSDATDPDAKYRWDPYQPYP
jgi:prepilin-type processing-associated H-X9-DG protein